MVANATEKAERYARARDERVAACGEGALRFVHRLPGTCFYFAACFWIMMIIYPPFLKSRYPKAFRL